VLRSWTIGIAAIVLVCGAAALLAGAPPAWVFVFWSAVIVLSIVYERFRYKPVEEAPPGGGWHKTAERFVDDESGEPVTVWVNDSGDRKYVRG
jgi:membrane protein implicated in regulation of membrane protease activity